ncbi:MAG TPA: MBOAT family O-acyltransferase [Pyrinomonadaceae bacterium]|nr:MBOAT family O-acyltransferase [Pyrinomonadaceae bacterium]
MVFNSLTFFVFFSVVLCLYYLPLSWGARKAILLAASYVFYGVWNPPFVLLLLFTTVVDWLTARWMERTEKERTRKALLLLSLVSNLGLLSYFKYGAFVLANFTAMLAAMGIHYSPPAHDIVLPVGISFYTFHTLSYTIDVYRQRLRATPRLTDFALFVSFFPALVAGPIIRASHFLPQLETPKRANRDQFGWGLTLIFVGLFEKVVLADALLAPVADRVYAATVNAGMVSAWTGTLAFSGQIFFDFAGYSTCAIGAALCLGFGLTKNFDYPYAAVGFSDFWRRWHISLSTWLRDYLYVPLGGNRASAPRVYANLMLTMLIGGLWHGAAWRFVVWGGLHGTYLVTERLLKSVLKKRAVAQTQPAPVPVAEGGFVLLSGRFAQVALALVTYALVCVAWVFFRAQDFASARGVAAAMIGRRREFMPLDAGMVAALAVVALMLVAHWRMRDTDLAEVAGRIPVWLRPLILTFLVVSIFFTLLSGDSRAFIYFQF